MIVRLNYSVKVLRCNRTLMLANGITNYVVLALVIRTIVFVTGAFVSGS